MELLKVENLYKSFDNVSVLNGINFSIDEGDILCIVGHSGNGKTTLLRILNSLETLDHGKISLNGKVILDENSKSLTKENQTKFGMVFQNFNLFPQYNLLDNLTLAPRILEKDKIAMLKLKSIERRKLLAKKQEEINSKAQDILKKVGLSDKAQAYPWQLSGGQCQRAAIARALALQPQILCFDEPTSALDKNLISDITSLLKSLNQQGVTLIIVTHDLDFAKTIASKVLLIENGRVEEFGESIDIFANPNSKVNLTFNCEE